MSEDEQKIIEKTREFAEAISESWEYKHFISSLKKLKQDSLSLNLIKEFQKKQIQLNSMNFDSGLMEDLEKLNDKINKNKVIQDYNLAQSELISLLRRANNVISIGIGMQFAYSQGGGCCG